MIFKILNKRFWMGTGQSLQILEHISGSGITCTLLDYEEVQKSLGGGCRKAQVTTGCKWRQKGWFRGVTFCQQVRKYFNVLTFGMAIPTCSG